MADAARLGIPPECVSSKSAKCQEESTSGQIHETGSESQCSEPIKQNIGCAVVRNELRELCAASNNSDQQSHSLSANGTENIHVKQLGVPPEDVSKRSECSAVNASTKLLAEGDYSSFEHIQDKPLQIPTAMSMNKQLQSFSGNVTENSLTEQFKLPYEDPGVNSKTAKTSCSGQMPVEQTRHSGFGTSSSEPAENHPSGSDFLQNEVVQASIPVPICSVNEQLQSISENVNMTFLNEQAGLPPEDVTKTSQTDKISCTLQTALQQISELGSGGVHSEPEKQTDQLDSVPAQNDEVKTGGAVSGSIVFEQAGPSIEAMAEDSPIGHLEPLLEDASKSPGDKEMEPLPEDATQNCCEQLETPSKNALKISSSLGPKDTQSPKSRKKKHMSRSSVGSDRVLRTRTGEKPKGPKLSNNVATLESSNSVANESNGEEKKRKKRKKRQRNRVIADEFSRIRTHLRYLVNRISYEKSLIDAYSSEGWKGFSLEKLKPEKELQRATSEILRRKLKIRDLFQRLDLLCAEGMFPESLFDSEGQIDSEDIFCAKCGSKEVSPDNDIILCDGACDRGFHQFCLEPPLLSDDIPPDDEGWLCPGCDCKVDCMDLLNESQGTDLSLTDSWEKVFSEEAAAASAGQNQEHNHGLPSDDSDDNDYNPDGPETDDEVQGEESSSDESEYASASDELETQKSNDEQYLGLPSDDSEDDDYNPDAPDYEDVKQESSSSDFTSDSEDLGATIDDNHMSFEDVEGPKSMPLDSHKPLRGSGGQTSRRGQNKHSLKDELLSLLESGPSQGGSAPVSGKRHIERLDYKKLHDETYGNIPSDSSDDEDWNDTATPSKRSPKGNTSIIKNGEITKDINHDLDENEHTPRRTPGQKSNVEDTSNLSKKPLKGSTKSRSPSARAGSSTSGYKRRGEAVTQRLYKSFKENRYPDRSVKESLAQELGLMAKQVSKWFENARHCLKIGRDITASENGTPSRQKNRKPLEQGDKSIGDSDPTAAPNKELPETDDPMTGCCSGDVKDSELLTREGGKPKPITPNNRKRKRRSDDVDPKIETPKSAEPAETNRKGSRVMTRRRKSVA